MRANAKAQKIKDKAAWLRAYCQPFTAEETKQEVERIQRNINIHGIDAFNNPMFVDCVRWAMTTGASITLPTDEQFISIFRT